MPTVKELNEAAPDTPTFVLFLYSQGLINGAAVEALGLTEDTKAPEGGRYEFVDGGAILHAEPNPPILYQMIAKPPQLLRGSDQFDAPLLPRAEPAGHDQRRRRGRRRARVPQGLRRNGAWPGRGDVRRIGYYLFRQTAGKEAEDFRNWTSEYEAGRKGQVSITASNSKGRRVPGAQAGDGKTSWPPGPTLA